MAPQNQVVGRSDHMIWAITPIQGDSAERHFGELTIRAGTRAVHQGSELVRFLVSRSDYVARIEDWVVDHGCSEFASHACLVFFLERTLSELGVELDSGFANSCDRSVVAKRVGSELFDETATPLGILALLDAVGGEPRDLKRICSPGDE